MSVVLFRLYKYSNQFFTIIYCTINCLLHHYYLEKIPTSENHILNLSPGRLPSTQTALYPPYFLEKKQLPEPIEKAATRNMVREYQMTKKQFQKGSRKMFQRKRQRDEIIAPNLHQCHTFTFPNRNTQ